MAPRTSEHSDARERRADRRRNRPRWNRQVFLNVPFDDSDRYEDCFLAYIAGTPFDSENSRSSGARFGAGQTSTVAGRGLAAAFTSLRSLETWSCSRPDWRERSAVNRDRSADDLVTTPASLPTARSLGAA